ncbi:MAG: hypothetical protein J7K82_04440 [Thermoproteales archaeon]|nr:hypothetical protein [Thermoproteales archaeon]
MMKKGDMNKEHMKKILKEVLEYYNAVRIPVKKFEEYLMEKYGYTREEAKKFWLRACMLGVAQVGAVATKDFSGVINVIRLKEEEEYEVLG